MITLQKGLPIEHTSSAADLFLNAFGPKFFPILGHGEKTKKLIESSLNTNYCISALENGDLVGILAIQEKNKSFVDISFSNIKSKYGLLKGLIKAVLLSLFTYKPVDNEFYIECVAVTDSAQGKGIGTRLFNELFSQAVNEGIKKITLEVINTNTEAKSLYERLGFQIEKSSSIWPFNKMMGWTFNEVIKMKKSIG
jgi:ribosomal protein S18 acetylase RimI-like enzyme